MDALDSLDSDVPRAWRGCRIHERHYYIGLCRNEGFGGMDTTVKLESHIEETFCPRKWRIMLEENWMADDIRRVQWSRCAVGQAKRQRGAIW